MNYYGDPGDIPTPDTDELDSQEMYGRALDDSLASFWDSTTKGAVYIEGGIGND